MLKSNNKPANQQVRIIKRKQKMTNEIFAGMPADYCDENGTYECYLARKLNTIRM